MSSLSVRSGAARAGLAKCLCSGAVSAVRYVSLSVSASVSHVYRSDAAHMSIQVHKVVEEESGGFSAGAAEVRVSGR